MDFFTICWVGLIYFRQNDFYTSQGSSVEIAVSTAIENYEKWCGETTCDIYGVQTRTFNTFTH